MIFKFWRWYDSIENLWRFLIMIVMVLASYGVMWLIVPNNASVGILPFMIVGITRIIYVWVAQVKQRRMEKSG